MPILRAAKRAFGAPGIAPRWTQSAKDAIGTAYSAGSTVWFTVSAGILNEVYYPTIDRPPDLPQARMFLGRPTGSPMPLMWAHAEYIKLLRSTHDGQVFDRIPAVAERYQGRRR